jgi:hypothetical protein
MSMNAALHRGSMRLSSWSDIDPDFAYTSALLERWEASQLWQPSKPAWPVRRLQLSLNPD